MEIPSPHPKKRRTDGKDEESDPTATKARIFCEAVVADLQQVDAAADTSGLIRCVMTDIPDVDSGITRNIVIREDDYAFWTAVLKELSEEDTSNRVAVVGSSGIGKSSTVAFAIRLLLEQKKKTLELLESG